jgi:pantoate--beta-alanine ligase
MQQISRKLHREGKNIGLVPTMGYLHKGHLSLISRSKRTADVTVVSIFVNPAQFGPREDFGKYPRDIKHDKNLLRNAFVDYVFIPDAEEIYQAGFQTYVNVENVTQILEGRSRPTHFRGVTTIVTMLLNIVNPDSAFFGQKDAQQAFVIQQMVRDLKFGTRIVVIPIVREKDGLALSSRNIYLTDKERTEALLLNHSLRFAENKISDGEVEVSKIISGIKRIISSAESSELDYVSIVDALNFTQVKRLVSANKYYILVACRIGKTRLIDNILIKA